MNKLSAVILSAVIITLVHATPAHALSLEHNTARFAACQHVLSIIATPHNPIGNNPHPACVPVGKGTQNTGKTSKTVDNVPAAVEPVTVAPVVNAPIVHNDPEPVVQDDKPVAPVAGNPGNTKNVGHAGENPNNANTMPLDNAGGDGNGEHGNQGVNH